MTKPYLNYRSILSLAALLSISASTFAANDEMIFMNNLSNTLTSVEKSPSFWPGFNVTARPFVVAPCFNHHNEHLYAFYFKPTNPAWQPMTISTQAVYYSPKDIYNIDASDIKRMEIDGQLTSVYNGKSTYMNGQFYCNYSDTGSNQLPEATAEALTVRLADYIFLDSPDADKRMAAYVKKYNDFEYVEFKKPESVALLYLEWLALHDYLQTANEDRLKEVIAIDAVRSKQVDPFIVGYENASFFSGLIIEYAHHQAINILGRAESDYLKNDSAFTAYHNPNIIRADIKPTEHLDFDFDMWEMKMFTGAAITYSAEKLNLQGWKDNNDYTVNKVLDVLQQHYAMSSDDLQRNLVAAKNRYGYDAIISNVTKNLKDYPDGRDGGTIGAELKRNASTGQKLPLVLKQLTKGKKK